MALLTKEENYSNQDQSSQSNLEGVEIQLGTPVSVCSKIEENENGGFDLTFEPINDQLSNGNYSSASQCQDGIE